jgi:hypothetical protein
MGMVISPESELGKELAKWNKPYVYNAFPRMMYKARRRPDGVVSVFEADDARLGGQIGSGVAEAWTRGCQKTVNDEAEQRRARDEGWRETQDEALKHFHELEKFVADAAAHRAHEDRNMSEKAKAEAAAHEEETFGHVAEVPEKPKAKRGRPRKAS